MHQPAPKLPPLAEARRIATLRSYQVLDTAPEQIFDDITRIAAAVCETPISVVNLIDAERQWFKAEVGLGVRETPLATSICAHAILEHDFLEAPDATADPRFAANPLVTGDPGLRFYAGALLKSPDGQPLGTVCVLDTSPRVLSPEQVSTLQALARQVMAHLEVRRMLSASQELNAHRARILATTGHDLKSPLRAAMYAIRQARGRSGDELDLKLDSAQTDLVLIEQKLSGLLASATGSAGVQAPALHPVSLQDTFNLVEHSWRRAAHRKDILLEFVPTAEVAIANDALLETLLGNLVSNAIKYTPNGGTVRVHCPPSLDCTRVEVSDTGIGMNLEEVEDYFAAFRQAHAASEGLGVGLWIVRQSAEALNAEIQVSSALGQGTMVAVSLQRPTVSS